MAAPLVDHSTTHKRLEKRIVAVPNERGALGKKSSKKDIQSFATILKSFA